MSQFKTPQEAIAACDAAGDQAWSEFASANGIKEEVDAVACAIAKKVFRMGYMAGAQFISQYIVSNLQKHAQNPVIHPNPQ